MKTNDKIRELIDQARISILECKGVDDPEVLTYDGIISCNDCPPEILFLLKEPNDGRDSSREKLDFSCGFDFTKIANKEAQKQNGKKPEHWDNLCYWTKAFKDIQAGNPHFFLSDSVQKCGGCLGEIAIVNIKKVPGGRNVKDYDAILSASTNPVCSKLIRDEISLIAPRLVVCCGTYLYAKTIFKVEKDFTMVSGAAYFVQENVVFLEFIHPTQYGAAAKRNLTYAYAKEVFSELKEMGLMR